MSEHSTTDRLAAARAFCALLEQERKAVSAAKEEERRRLREQRELAKEQEKARRQGAAKTSRPTKVYARAQNPQDFVYVISASNGYCKIGISHDPQKRFRNLQREAATWAISLELVHVIPTNKAYILEQSLHKRFSAQRVIGEWFLLAAADIKWLKKQ